VDYLCSLRKDSSLVFGDLTLQRIANQMVDLKANLFHFVRITMVLAEFDTALEA
jgi:hypothetical protein